MNIVAPLLLLFSAQSAIEEPAGPRPAAFPITWEFRFDFVSPPRRIDVILPGDSAPTTFWYLLYTVTNTDARTRKWYPRFQVVTDDLRVVEMDVGINPLVFNAIKQLHTRTFPDLIHPSKAIGNLRTGADNAIESVAIWRDVDLSSSRFKIYVGGLSGETMLVTNPAFDPEKPETREIDRQGRSVAVEVNPKRFTLRKTLEIRYNHPGSAAGRAASEPVRYVTRWVMR